MLATVEAVRSAVPSWSGPTWFALRLIVALSSTGDCARRDVVQNRLGPLVDGRRELRVAFAAHVARRLQGDARGGCECLREERARVGGLQRPGEQKPLPAVAALVLQRGELVCLLD